MRYTPIQRLASALAISAVCAIGVAGCASSSNATTEAISYRGAPQNIQEFEVDGINVILRPTGPHHHTVFAKLFIRGGLPALPEGVSPTVEALALDVPRASGPANMTKSEFKRETDRLRILMGASAERDFSTLSLKTVDENFDRAWELWTSMITNPGYDPVEIENIKERTITALRNRRASPEAYANYLADSVFFYNHPYGRHATEEAVPGITEQMIRDYHDQLLVKSRIFLVVVGNLTREELEQKVAATFGNLPEGDYEQPPIPVPESATRPQVVVRAPIGREDVPTNYIVARYLAPSRTDSLYWAMRRLTSFVSGSLFREIRIERNLSYAPGAENYYHRLGFGDISVSTQFPDSAWRVARTEVLDFFRDYYINDEYVTGNLTTWIVSHYMDEQTAESQATEMGAAEFYTGSWSNAFRTFEELGSLTSEEINAAARRYLKNFTVIIVGDPSVIDPAVYMPETEAMEASVEKEVSSGRGNRKGNSSSNSKGGP